MESIENLAPLPAPETTREAAVDNAMAARRSMAATQAGAEAVRHLRLARVRQAADGINRFRLVQEVMFS